MRMWSTRELSQTYDALEDNVRLGVAGVVRDAGAVDEVDPLAERDVLPHLFERAAREQNASQHGCDTGLRCQA